MNRKKSYTKSVVRPPQGVFGGSILLDDAMIDDDGAICEIERVLPVLGPEVPCA